MDAASRHVHLDKIASLLCEAFELPANSRDSVHEILYSTASDARAGMEDLATERLLRLREQTCPQEEEAVTLGNMQPRPPMDDNVLSDHEAIPEEIPNPSQIQESSIASDEVEEDEVAAVEHDEYADPESGEQLSTCVVARQPRLPR